ncbi:MAG: hypothetical protein ACRCTA_00700 [Bacilli bacterium]
MRLKSYKVDIDELERMLLGVYNDVSQLQSLAQSLENARLAIVNSEYSHFYDQPYRAYTKESVDEAYECFRQINLALYNYDLHSEGVSKVDSLACDKIGNVLELLNKVNGEKNKYTSKHIKVNVTKDVANASHDGMSYTIDKVTTSVPLTADELMKLEYGPLKEIGDKYNKHLKDYINKQIANEKLSLDDIEALKKLDLASFIDYN